MSSRNNQTIDAVGTQPFHPRRPAKEAPREKWHQIGSKVSEVDKIPEFHAQTLKPGTAPAGSSFRPNPIYEVPGQANNEDTLRGHGKEQTYTKPLDTYPGGTSKDVHKNNAFSRPMIGQTSNEKRHAGAEHRRKHHGSGLEGVGATAPPKHSEGSYGDPQKVDPKYNPGQRALDREEAKPGTRGDKGAAGAEDLPPQSAESVASELK